jgi:hypothetical protein
MQPTQTFLLIGQSNMAGRRDIATVKPIVDFRIMVCRNDNWVQAMNSFIGIARKPELAWQ